ncbi:hypothetical protein GCM10007350_11430 [Jeongeupia chitinilytica]|uniref:Uncharacterized protein n=1 Tax=Jeongeupia chitinilytica TaxID=1041641 RepID=A0ABQ3GZ45_9NEIS|nr:hypothetical protein GCM10007350_11430 [Jeongeupia chitinilytica]
MHFDGQELDTLGQLLGELCQLGILLQQFQHLCRVLRGNRLPLFVGRRERLSMLRIGLGERFVCASRMSGAA